MNDGCSRLLEVIRPLVNARGTPAAPQSVRRRAARSPVKGFVKGKNTSLSEKMTKFFSFTLKVASRPEVRCQYCVPRPFELLSKSDIPF